MNYTKGPWKQFTGTYDYGKEVKIVASNNDSFYCMIGGENRQDNAHLIASAPDLLEACKALLKDLEQDFEITANELQSAYVLRQVITKAEGRE